MRRSEFKLRSLFWLVTCLAVGIWWMTQQPLILQMHNSFVARLTPMGRTHYETFAPDRTLLYWGLTSVVRVLVIVCVYFAPRIVKSLAASAAAAKRSD
jgi:hypothetical protein